MYVFGIFIIITFGTAHAERYIIPLFGLNATESANNTDLILIVISENDTVLSASGIVANSSISPISVNVTRNVRNTITLSGLPFLNSTRIGNDSLLVESTENITLQVITRFAGYYEGFMAIPTTALGNEYYVDTFCALGGYCQVTIATTVAGTTKVFLRLPSSSDDEIMFCTANSYWKSGRDKVVRLDYPDTLQISSPRDLTGSHIYTDNPVSVLVGAHSIQNGGNVFHYLEQLVPTTEWGKEFIFNTIGNSSYGDVIGITAVNDSTVVKMNGFQDTGMASGQFIKRRVEPNSLNHVTSNNPIQVMLFTSFESATLDSTTSVLTANNPGMSLVPAVEHTEASSIVSCLNTGNTTASLQFLSLVSLTFTNFITESIDRLPYSLFDVYAMQPSENVKNGPYYLVHSEGMIVCEGTALMPTVKMVLPVDSSTCTPDLESMFPGDGLDNDCDGAIDNEYCFENKMVENSFFTSSDNSSEPHSEDISGFRTLKLRIASLCEISNIDLRDEDNGIVTIQISTMSINLHSFLFGDTLLHVREDLSMYHLECERIYPFWLLQTDTQICFDIGPVPQTNCSNTTLTIDTTVPMSVMRIGSSYTNVTYWIDIHRKDCGRLHSTWRCADLVANCSDYGPDVCSNYVTWSQAYCGVYCGLCIPDSYGQTFVLTLPATTDTQCVKTISMFPKQPQQSAVPPVIGIGLTNKNDMNNTLTFVSDSMHTPNGDTLDYTAIEVIGNAADNSNIYIYADDDIRVTVDYNCPTGGIKLAYAVEPVDTSGIEYMTSFFLTSITCHIIAHDGKAVIQKLKPDGVTLIGTIDANAIATINLVNAETTGTILLSNRPVTVYCGNVGYEASWQQLLPTTTWGKRYVIPATTDANVQQITLGIITNSDYTVVFVNGDFDLDFVLAKRGDFHSQEIQKGHVYTITANRPISVGLLYHASAASNSFWTILPSASNFINGSELFVPRSGLYYSSVIISSVDSAENTTDESYNIANTVSNAVYHFVNESSEFMLGRTTAEVNALLYVASTCLFKDLSQELICTLPGNNTVGDGLDNDCDGLIDEETVCYTGFGADQSDVDRDGGFCEDCQSEDTVTTALPSPDLPVCYINTTRPGCWRVCASCECSWVINLEAYNKLTKEEQMVYNLNITTGITTNLTVDKATLSTEKAKVESAPDDRQTSKNIGYVGYLALAATFSLFVFFDLTNLVAYIRRKRSISN